MATPKKIPQQNPIMVVSEQASNADPYHRHHTPGFDEPKLIPQNPAAMTTLDLSRELVIPSKLAYWLGIETPSVDHGDVLAPAYVDVKPADTTVVDPLAVLRANSRVARAGASILIQQEPPMRVDQGLQLMYHGNAMFRGVDPAPFALVNDGAVAADSPTPTHDAIYDFASCPSYGFTTLVTRQMLKGIGGDGIRAAILIGVLKGLGELADRLVLSAIIAAQPANPPAFNLGLAAARHARFDELRGLIGTNGTGATIAGDGSLRAGGVFAELTAGCAQTIVGRFVRSAVAVKGDVSVHGIRQNPDGSVRVSCFANMQPVIQDAAGDFWEVTA